MSKIKQEKKVKGKVANFASLKERFVAAARNQFGPDEIDAEINDINQRWIPLVEIQNLSREDLGIIVLEKHELYTKKRIWPEVEAAIADGLGCCRRSVVNLRLDAKRALAECRVGA